MVFWDWMADVAIDSGKRKPTVGKKNKKAFVMATKTQELAQQPSCKIKSMQTTRRTDPFMQPSRNCLSGSKLFAKLCNRPYNQIDMPKFNRYKAWIQQIIMPKMNRGSGKAVSVSEMERITMFLGEFCFWNTLSTTRQVKSLL